MRIGILSNIFDQRPSASLDSIMFDASRYDLQGDRDGARVWFLPEGGGVRLYFFPRKPDLPEHTATYLWVQLEEPEGAPKQQEPPLSPARASGEKRQ